MNISQEFYRKDREFADRYADQQLAIFKSIAVHTSTFERDVRFASDFMVWRVRYGPRVGQPLGDVAARIRTSGNFWQRSPRGQCDWGLQFTIRTRRDSGAETELSKIRKGWADWFGYGHIEQDQYRHWMVLDLEVFRSNENKPSIIPEQKNNNDGTYFNAYDVRTFPREIIIALSPTMQVAIDRGVNAVEPLPSTFIEREPPPPCPCDLQQLVARFGGYDKITPEAWTEWDETNKKWQAQRRDYYAGLRPASHERMAKGGPGWTPHIGLVEAEK